MSTTVDYAYDALHKMVLNKELKAGQRVSQRKLARRLGCSSVPVAEAMRRLESEGLLVKEPLKMAKVRKLTLRDLEGLYLMREGMEAVAARLCAERITAEQMLELRQLGQKYEEAIQREDHVEFARLDAEIHRFIFRCSQCPLLEEELRRLFLIENTASRERNIPLDKEKDIVSHRAIIQAICDRDGNSAEYFTKKHIAAGYQEIVRGFSEK